MEADRAPLETSVSPLGLNFVWGGKKKNHEDKKPVFHLMENYQPGNKTSKPAESPVYSYLSNSRSLSFQFGLDDEAGRTSRSHARINLPIMRWFHCWNVFFLPLTNWRSWHLIYPSRRRFCERTFCSAASTGTSLRSWFYKSKMANCVVECGWKMWEY